MNNIENRLNILERRIGFKNEVLNYTFIHEDNGIWTRSYGGAVISPEELEQLHIDNAEGKIKLGIIHIIGPKVTHEF